MVHAFHAFPLFAVQINYFPSKKLSRRANFLLFNFVTTLFIRSFSGIILAILYFILIAVIWLFFPVLAVSSENFILELEKLQLS